MIAVVFLLMLLAATLFAAATLSPAIAAERDCTGHD